MVKLSNFSRFIERYQNCLKHETNELQFFKFEDCIVQSTIKACDYAIVYRKRKELILIECKRGSVNPSDFNKGIEQLENSIEKIVEEFNDPPDRAILCYEKLYHTVFWKLRYLKKLKHEVHFEAKRIGSELEIEPDYCRIC